MSFFLFTVFMGRYELGVSSFVPTVFTSLSTVIAVGTLDITVEEACVVQGPFVVSFILKFLVAIVVTADFVAPTVICIAVLTTLLSIIPVVPATGLCCDVVGFFEVDDFIAIG